MADTSQTLLNKYKPDKKGEPSSTRRRRKLFSRWFDLLLASICETPYAWRNANGISWLSLGVGRVVARHRNAKGAFEVEEKGWLRSRFDVSTGFSLPLTNNRDGRNEKNARRVVHFPPRIRTRVSRSIANGDKFIHDSKKKKKWWSLWW